MQLIQVKLLVMKWLRPTNAQFMRIWPNILVIYMEALEEINYISEFAESGQARIQIIIQGNVIGGQIVMVAT